jgi:hypothetical protein
MTPAERMIYEMMLWEHFVNRGGDPRIATTEWVE